jgi:parallel beta-helix repeat protein
VEVRGNRFVHDTDPAIVIRNSRDIVVSGNTLTGGRGRIDIAGSSDEETIDITRPFERA